MHKLLPLDLSTTPTSHSVYMLVQERLRQFQEHMDAAVAAVDAGKQEQRNLENTHVQDK